MRKFTFLMGVVLSTLMISVPAHAARGIVVKRPDGGTGRTVSLDTGVYCYTIYEARSESPKIPSTFYFEVSLAADGVCLDDLKGRSIPENSVSLGLVSTLPVLEPAPAGIASVNQVRSLTTMELVSHAGAPGSTGPVAMKKGTVKFFNETKGIFVHATGLADRGDELFLVLPEELQKLVDALSKDGSRVIIILRELRDGKKGLNAVNVKLA